jgi:hypothetical protein
VYCCDAFQGHISLAGQRGLAILAREDSSGRIRLMLQSRGVAFEDEHILKPYPLELTINIASATGLRFCPWCGRNTEDLIEESPELFRKLAGEHKKFISSLPGL